MICTNCGNEIPDSSKWCPNCGQGVKRPAAAKPVMPQAPTQTPAPAPTPAPQSYPQQPVNNPSSGYNSHGVPPMSDDEPSFGLNLVSFISPLVGLILFAVFKESKPNKAKACGRWALISFVVSFIFGFIGGLLSL